MSSTTQLPISEELLSFWATESKSGKTRTIRVIIKNEECVLAEHFDKGEESIGHDFNTLMALVSPSEPSYILFRKSDTESSGNWLFITFIPDKSKVSDKLVYAASILHLKKSLGVNFFTPENLNYAVLSDFSWASYTSSGPSREECFNEREKHIQELDKMEAQARIEQEEDARAKAQMAVSDVKRSTPANTAPEVKRTPNAAPRPVKTQGSAVQRNALSGAARPLPVRGGGSVGNLTRAFETGTANGSNDPVSSVSYGGNSLNGECGMRTDCIGGYHTVRLPFKSEASEALDALAGGSVNVVSLKIEDEHICLDSSATVTASQVASYLSEVEPRFVLYKEGPSAVFIYCCPDKSRPRIRIVYSTSKPSIVEEAGKHGISVGKKLEIRGRDEAGADVLSRPSYARGSPYSSSGYSRGVNTNAKASVSTPHPVYSQINPNGNRASGGMKKIVMPPPGAYN